MLNHSKEVLCIFVSFQECQDSIKEEPETNAYNILYHIGGDFKAV